jgi:GT2 family glycosyltransferase
MRFCIGSRVPEERASAAASAAASVIVPFHKGRADLERVVAVVSNAAAVHEVIVVANGHDEDLARLEQVPRLRLLSLPAACGPAVARNRGAALAAASILVFVDADVVPHESAIPLMVQHLADGDVAAVFGAYDHTPAHPGFFSQYRNLAHAFVHERARGQASTFWAGLGAVRASAFAAVGGFDERFRRPSIEDIDLGYRLRAAGGRLRLDPSIRGTHLRRWTLRSSIVTDVRDRGVPWTQALFKFGALTDDLNISWAGRAALVFAWFSLAFGCAALFWRPAAWGALAAFLAFVMTQWPLILWFNARRGGLFAAGVLAGQLLHNLCNGVSLVTGVSLWGMQSIGWRTGWSLDPDPWSVTSAASRDVTGATPR